MVDARSQSLIQERAAIRAHYRTARIEGRLSMGISASRPAIPEAANIFRSTQGPIARYSYWGYYSPVSGPYPVP
jgi:hypothetical protein